MNTWVRFTYVDDPKKVVDSTVCSVEGCGKPRHPMGEKQFRKMCKEHFNADRKEYMRGRKFKRGLK